MLGSQAEADGLVRALAALRAALGQARLPLDRAGADDARAELESLRRHLDDYLVPRVRQAGAPLLAVVGGSTGAGKSTLVNTLVGERVSEAGVLRPTTRAPVLVHHPDDVAWFASDRVLPSLARVTGPAAGPTGTPSTGSDDGAPARSVRLVAHPRAPRGLALLDAPDIDSVVVENRTLGAELLGAADVWVFVTTAARYADAVSWDLLAAAARRRAVVALVLNRVDPPAEHAVAADLSRMLTENGLADSRLVTVRETRTDGGRLPADAVADLRAWLDGLAGDGERRRDVVAHGLRGALDDVLRRAPALAAALDAQAAHAARLHGVVAAAYDEAARDLVAATSDGTLLRGEVLARWQEFVGTGELLRAVEERVGTLRDRLTALVRGRRPPEPVAAAIGSGLVDLVVDAADRAADRAFDAWRTDAAGAALLDGLRLSRSSADLRTRASGEVRAWQGAVLDLVAHEGADRRATARALSFGVNGLGAALMVAIFASTGGLTAAEVGVAGGTAVLAQRLLEAVFGDDAVRRLTRSAQEDLVRRVRTLLDAEAARFTSALDAVDVAPDAGAAVRAAAHDVARASAWLVPPAVPPGAAAAGRGTEGEALAGSAPTDVPTGRALASRVVRWWQRLWRG